MISWPSVIAKLLTGGTVDKNSVKAMFEKEIEDAYKAGRDNEAFLMQTELSGGRCPMCGKAFIKKSTKIKGIEIFDYYQPNCECYPKCPICDRPMLWETSLGMKACRHCGYITCWNKVSEKIFLDDSRKTMLKNKVCGGKIYLKTDGYWICSQCGMEYGYHQLKSRFIVNDDI